MTTHRDAAGCLTDVHDWPNNNIRFGYDVNSNISGEVFPTGTNTTAVFSYVDSV